MTEATLDGLAAAPSTDGITALSAASPAQAAENYAQRGFRVVPLYGHDAGVCTCKRGCECGAAGKHPWLRQWEQKASTDHATVADWFLQRPGSNVGLAMGGPERLVALDIDGADGRASLAKLEQLYFPLPETLTSRSGRVDGGEHRLFRLAPTHNMDAVKNNAGRIGMKRGAKKTDPRPFPALDIRGDGGQIVVCPSVHKSGNPYTWTNEAPIAELPEWFYRLLVPTAEPEPTPAPAPRPQLSEAELGDRYATAALERACDEVRTAPKGTRNDTLNREAYGLGQLVGSGVLRHSDTEARLLDAMRAGGWDANAVRTLHSTTLRRALNDGTRNPRVIPNRPVQAYKGAPPALQLEPQDRWTALEVLLEELRTVNESGRNEAALQRSFLNAVLASIEGDRCAEGARLVERLRGLGVKTNPWKMALRSRRKEQIDEQTAAMPPAENEDRPRRTIVVKPGDLGNLVRQSLTLLRDDLDVYVRDGELVTVVPSDGTDRPPKISMLQPETVRVHLADAAKWIVPMTDDGGMAITDPPMPVVASVCADPNKKDIRRLDAIVEAPTLGPNGQLVDQAGYHESARLVLMPTRSFPGIPENPTRDDAREALKQLREVFVNFDYETEVDRVIPLAALLSLVARPAIRGPVPGFGFSANSKGTGKSLQVKCIIAIAYGREAEDDGWPGDDEAELRKKLDSAALDGARYVWYDNLETVFGGGPLAAYLTSTRASPRPLGQSRRVSCPWHGVIMATGNNLRLGRDIDRRMVMNRILSRHERPFLRPASDFRHAPLDAWALEHHPRLLVAALTIVRAWMLANRPVGTCPTYGSFEAWSRLVPDALEWAGAENPLKRAVDAPEENETDEDRALRVVLRDLVRLDSSGAGLKTTDVIKLLYPLGRPPRRDDGPPDGFDDLRDAIESVVRGRTPSGVPQGNPLGKWLSKQEHRSMGGVWLHQDWGHNHIARWRVVPVPAASFDEFEQIEREAIQAVQ